MVVMMMMMNRRGTIWLQRLHSHHLHQSHGQHPIPRVGKNWDCYLQTFKKTILRTQVSSQLWNKQQTNINHNLKQHNKKTKKNTDFFFRTSSIHISISPTPFPASSPPRNVPAPHHRLLPWRNRRQAGLPEPWPAPRGVPQHWAPQPSPVGQEDLAAAPTEIRVGRYCWWNKIRLTMLILENIPIFHRVFIDHRWCRIVYLSVHVCQLCSGERSN